MDYDVIMLVLNDVAHDRRVRAAAAALAGAGWRVLVIGTQRADGLLPDRARIAGFDLWRVRYGRFGARLWRPWRWVRHGLQAIQLVRAVRRVTGRVYHAHDLPALILLWLARLPGRRATPLVYDSHELFLFQSPRAARLANAWHALTLPVSLRIERALARRARAVITVSEPLARTLALRYGIARPVVVRNALDPLLEGDNAAPVNLRALAGAGRWLVVHSGTVTDRGRCLSEAVAALVHLPDDVALAFLGQGEAASDLRVLAWRLGVAERVNFVLPVPPEDVARTIQAADAMLVALRPDSANIWAALPNKLFEAVAAGVPVVASDTFTLARVVRRYDLGAVCDARDPAALAEAIRAVLSPAGQARYRAGVRAAQRDLTWADEAAKLCALYAEVLR